MRKLLLLAAWPIFVVLLAGNFCLGASVKTSISPDSVLARVNDQTVTVGNFYDHLRESKITAVGPEADRKTKKEALHKLIREMLIDQKAASLDMESDPSFVAQRDRHMQGWLLDYMYKQDLEEPIGVSDQEVRDHYQKYREVDFVIPEEARVRDLLIRVWVDSTQDEYQKKLKKADKEAKKKIRDLHKRAKRGEDFADLCRQYTQAPVPDRTGNLGFVPKGRKSAEFDRAAFSLSETGEISEPFRDDQGYHMLQLLDRKERSYHQLDTLLFERIREYLRTEKVRVATAGFVDSLRGETRWVYNPDVLNSSRPPGDSDTWVLAFGQADTIRYRRYAEALSVYKFEMGLDSVGLDHKKFLLEYQLALPVVLEREAEKRGYADMVECRAEERAFTLDEAEKKLLSTRVTRDFPPATREELEEYYRAHKIDFPSLGVPLHVYHIVLDDSVKAADILNQIRRGQDFETMAKMYFPGEPEMRGVAYDLGFISQGEMPEEFYQAALALQVGGVSEPVRTRWGYHLIKLVEREKKGTTFEDIIPVIQRAIDLEKGRRHIADWEEILFDEARVRVDEKLLDELQLPKPEG